MPWSLLLNPTVLLGIALAGAMGWGAIQTGRLDRAQKSILALRGEYAIRDRQAQEAADKRLQAALLRVREAERKSAEDVAAVAVKLEKEKNDAAKRAQKVISDLHTGVLALRVQLDTRGADPGSGGSPGEAGARAGQRDGGPGSRLPQPVAGTLSRADSEFLIAEASRADEVVSQLQACQAVILADREVCR